MAEHQGFDLASLLDTVSNLDTGTNDDREKIVYIGIDAIDDDPNNFYSLTGLTELATNIQLFGLQQPLRVRTGENDRFVIVSGHRRRAALQQLVNDGLVQYRQVPCIREASAETPALQELRLIYANSDTRTLTPADISKQAERVEILLYQLKEDGFEFPGKMRDHVAEACKVSASKLARLKVIREKLVQQWQLHFESGVLNESAAYTLAKTSELNQQKILALFGKDKRDLGNIWEHTISGWIDELNALKKIKCTHGESTCTNADAMWAYSTDSRHYCAPCNHCCEKCYNRENCKAVCPKFLDEILARKRNERQENKTAKQLAAEHDAAIVQQIQDSWTRFGLARRTAGVSVKAVCEAVGAYYSKYEDESYTQRENGEDKLNISSATPYSNLRPQKIVELAELLGCSVDYLFMRTDNPHSNHPTQEEFWRSGDPIAPGYYLCLSHQGTGKLYFWSGTSWQDTRAICNLTPDVRFWRYESDLPAEFMSKMEPLSNQPKD